ncbi:MAG: M16 family metallopeptidase [Acidobacteriota bacterium]
MDYQLNGVTRHRLPNGLTVITREDHSVPIVASMIWYRVGSRMERPGITGISHLLEHMMFKGTRRYAKGEIDYITTRHGGSNNAFTSHDYTAYYFTFASDRWHPALEIEADRMENATFDPEEFELERQVVLEELRMDLDSPWGALRQAVETASFQTHPYRFPIIGTTEDVSKVTIEELKTHYRGFYAPNNSILVLVGDFIQDEVIKEVEAVFGCIAPHRIPVREVPAEPRRREENRVELRKTSHVPRLLWAFPAPSVHEREHYAIEMIDKLLSEGKLARLYKRLVEQERVMSGVLTEFDETQDPYLFFIRGELQPDVDPARVEELMTAEIDRLLDGPLPDAELKRARNQCLSQFLADFETPLDQAVQLGLLETLRGFEYWNSYVEQIQSVTRDDIRAAAGRYLLPKGSTKGILINEQS